MEKRIGLIGLGNIGINIARNLIEAGYHLQVYNRSLSKADTLKTTAVTKCLTPAGAADGVPVIITILSDDEVVKNVVLGKDGILSKLPKDSLHISMSTISPKTSQLLSEYHREAGNMFLAAPLFGRPEAVAAKKIWICVSGEKKAKEMAGTVLANLGQGIVDFGEDAGAANTIKIAGNFMILASLEMMAEAYTLAEKQGIDPVKVAEFFGSTIFNAPIFQNYGKLIARKQYEPVGFTSQLGYKDARLTIALSQASATPMPFATTIHNRMLSAIAKGRGGADWVEGISRGVSEEAGL
jgi:3-hydroxyisobutyrate dehydrogenase-like beta-hydroxyacid dehydrogenase